MTIIRQMSSKYITSYRERPICPCLHRTVLSPWGLHSNKHWVRCEVFAVMELDLRLLMRFIFCCTSHIPHWAYSMAGFVKSGHRYMLSTVLRYGSGLKARKDRGPFDRNDTSYLLLFRNCIRRHSTRRCAPRRKRPSSVSSYILLREICAWT